jgi:hypothetical protein
LGGLRSLYVDFSVGGKLAEEDVKGRTGEHVAVQEVVTVRFRRQAFFLNYMVSKNLHSQSRSCSPKKFALKIAITVFSETLQNQNSTLQITAVGFMRFVNITVS